MLNDFAVFIISHGRAENQITRKKLIECGYTGNIHILIDDTDPELNKYKELYEKELLIFNKKKYISEVDKFINEPIEKTALYARQAVEDIAKEMKLKAFCIMDDDLKTFNFRFIDGSHVRGKKVNNFNEVFESYVNYLKTVNISSLSFGTNRMYIGVTPDTYDKVERACAYVFIRNTDYEMNWKSIMLEDLIVCLEANTTGKLTLALPFIMSDQDEVQQGTKKNGTQETYKMLDTYQRAFFAIMAFPSFCKVKVNNKNEARLRCNSVNSLPKIISNKYKKI